MQHISHALVETSRPPAYKSFLYWGKKPPNIVRTYIDNYCPTDGVVLDPFVGSGITVCEGVASGRRAIGIDLNPVGLFFAEDLLVPLVLDEYDAAVSVLGDTLDHIASLYLTSQTCERCQTPFTAAAICFHWQTDELVAVRAECPKCKHRGTYSPTTADRELARGFQKGNPAEEEGLWTPDVALGYTPTRPFIKVGGDASPRLREYFSGRNWLALATLRAAIGAHSDERIRSALLATFGTFVHLASSMMMVRKTRPDSSSLARQAYWLPDVFMESNVADLFGRAVFHRQGYRGARLDANERFGSPKRYPSANALLKGTKPGFRLICDSALDMSRSGKDRVPDASIDYIFTDPPYGGAIQYLEMFTLWQAWLAGPNGPPMPMDYEEEITVNDAQGKSVERYNQLMTAAFRECYRVLKAKSWMHVTFHHTDVSTFTGIVEAAETVGFDLQLVNYQPPLRPSDKALAQPYGSAVGNYFLRFFKSASSSPQASPGTVTPDVYENLVRHCVTKILAKRGEPTPFTQIMNEIYVDLSKKGVMLSGQKAPADVLKASDEFMTIETDSGALWWFSDASSIPGLETVPLNERIEKAVLAVLRRNVRVTFDDVLQEVLISFPNSLTPESGTVMDLLQSYASHDDKSPGVWRLRSRADEELAHTEHSRMIAEIAQIGHHLGLAVQIGRNESDDLWESRPLKDLEAGNPFPVPTGHYDDSTRERIDQIDCIWFREDRPLIAFEVENTTTITEGIVRMANVPNTSRRVIVLPQARKGLLARKLREPMLSPDGVRDWHFMYYERITELLADARTSALNLDGFLRALETEPDVDQTGQGVLQLG